MFRNRLLREAIIIPDRRTASTLEAVMGVRLRKSNRDLDNFFGSDRWRGGSLRAAKE